MRKDNFIQVLKLFVQKLNIPITSQSVENELAIHPDYKSFDAISDLLNTWSVPSTAIQITCDKLLEFEIVDPFIAETSNKQFVVVSHLDENYAVVSNEKWKNYRLTLQQFKEIYAGSILIAEKDSTSGEKDYSVKRRKEIYDRLFLPLCAMCGIIILSAFLIYHLSYFTDYSWYSIFLILIKTAGIATVVLLLLQTFHSNNPILQKLCGSFYSKDCQAILSSKEAKVYNLLSWSEIGLFYFGGSWVLLLFNGDNLMLLGILSVLNLISLPYTFYSFYYQWKVAREWCILCCIVQALLWLEFIFFLPIITNGLIVPNTTVWINFALGMIIPIILWTFIKPYHLLSKQLKQLKSELYKFKYNRDVFQTSLNKSAKYPLVSEEDSIVIGNALAKNILTVVIRPYGKVSAEAYEGLNWLLDRDDIKLQIIFYTPFIDPDNQVATHMLSLKGKKDSLLIKKAIDDWYNQKRKNYDTWAEVHHFYKIDTAKSVLTKNNEWCSLTNVKEIPEIFINGQRLDLNYKTADLKYFFSKLDSYID